MDTAMDTTMDTTYTQFACIGSGFSGIGLGTTLRRWHNITDLAIFERESSLGGTWTTNQYPGAACDLGPVQLLLCHQPNLDAHFALGR